jgi:hypothetical protein
VSKKPEEVSYFVVDQTEKISENLFRFKITTPKGTHYSTGSKLNALGNSNKVLIFYLEGSVALVTQKKFDPKV